MTYCLGVDLGTSAVKVLLADQTGRIVGEASESYPVYQPRSGWSEQDPEVWVEKTIVAISRVLKEQRVLPDEVEGLSFSGQMHGLVLLDQRMKPLGNAILWNDTRTSRECREIEERLGRRKLLAITKNRALEGFTLPKLLWVKKQEPSLYEKAALFLLPKDYVRFRLTGEVAIDYSDAAGTLLFNVAEKTWSETICRTFDIDPALCPPPVAATAEVGTVRKEIAEKAGLSRKTKVFAGGADNACGAVGAGILAEGNVLSSIGTSGVVLSYETSAAKSYDGVLHHFNHAVKEAYYVMGVTLAAGDSFTWFKNTFAKDDSFSDLANAAARVAPGASGLLFAPYLSGERTPHADAQIRGSFIGIDRSHEKAHFVRAVMEGITFSLNESMHILREKGKPIETVVAIGGGARSESWLQMQADIYDAPVVRLENEQGPGLGACIIAAYGSGWFDSLSSAHQQMNRYVGIFEPLRENVKVYQELFAQYRDIYPHTKKLSAALQAFRQSSPPDDGSPR